MEEVAVAERGAKLRRCGLTRSSSGAATETAEQRAAGVTFEAAEGSTVEMWAEAAVAVAVVADLYTQQPCRPVQRAH